MMPPTFWIVLIGACRLDYGLKDEDSAVVPAVDVTETFDQAPRAGVDVLFVVDGTGSMVEEQATLAAAASRFVDALTRLSVAWQVGVTSTDPLDEGVLLGRPWIITRNTPDSAAIFADNLTIGGDRLPPSAGLYAAVSALADADGANFGFRREDASLHLVFVSDDDDASDAHLGADPVAALLAVVDAEAQRSGRSVKISALVGDSPGGCSGPGGEARAGTRYTDLAEATGGLALSICQADLSGVAEALGAEGLEWPREFALQAVPVPGSAVVRVDGARVLEGWTVASAVLIFDEAPAPGAHIEVDYRLEEGT